MQNAIDRAMIGVTVRYKICNEENQRTTWDSKCDRNNSWVKLAMYRTCGKTKRLKMDKQDHSIAP